MRRWENALFFIWTRGGGCCQQLPVALAARGRAGIVAQFDWPQMANASYDIHRVGGKACMGFAQPRR